MNWIINPSGICRQGAAGIQSCQGRDELQNFKKEYLNISRLIIGDHTFD